jgi:hypothetical protein
MGHDLVVFTLSEFFTALSAFQPLLEGRKYVKWLTYINIWLSSGFAPLSEFFTVSVKPRCPQTPEGYYHIDLAWFYPIRHEYCTKHFRGACTIVIGGNVGNPAFRHCLKGKLMRIRALYLTAALALAFAPNANATIVGSTYDFTSSVTGNTQISPLGAQGAHTDPANVGFCVGPPVECGTGSGVTGFYNFATVSPTLDTITFSFFGSTFGAGPGTFAIDLGHFVTTDGETVTGVTHASGNLLLGDFTNVSFNGTDAIFTGTAAPEYNAIGGASVVFNVTTQPVPAPLIGHGLLVLLAVGGVLFGAKFSERIKNRRLLGTAA